MADPPGPDEAREAAQRARDAGTARFRFSARMAPGSDPLEEREGTVDFQRPAYAAPDQLVVEDALYAVGYDGVWWRRQLEGREPIGPVWVAAIAAAMRTDEVAERSRASEWLGRELEWLGGVRGADRTQARVSVGVGNDGLPRRVAVTVADHEFTCDFWDYGVETDISAPDDARDVRRPSHGGVLGWAVRGIQNRLRGG